MKKVYFVATLLFFLFSYASAYAAGVPLIIGYQGRLTNTTGDLLTGTYYFKFSIWDDPTSNPSTGNKLWPTGDPGTVTKTVSSGIFNVNIDTSSYNFNTNKDIYLQVEVSSSGLAGTFEALSPRQRISSVPFAQVSGAVSGTGQSSFGTTAPFGTSVVSIQATSTQSTGLSIQGVLNQLANLFQIKDSTGFNLFTVDNSGNVAIGTSTATRKFNILDTSDNPQLQLVKENPSGLILTGEFRTDSAGDVRISSTGGNIRQNNENLWVCSGDGCATDATPPAGEGNMVIENSFIFDNGFKFKQDSASTTMYDAQDNPILQFDDGQ